MIYVIDLVSCNHKKTHVEQKNHVNGEFSILKDQKVEGVGKKI